MPLGQLPVLTLPSGKVVTQSGAHARFAAKKAGLYPRDDDEAALFIDEIVFAAEDVLAKCPQDPDVEVKKAKRAAFAKDVLPKYLKFLADKLGAGPFYGGASINLADLSVFALIDAINSGGFDYIDAHVLHAFPALLAHALAVREHPIVVKHGELAPAAPAPAPAAPIA